MLLSCLPENPPRVLLPIFAEKVRAGFPNPAQDHIASTLDLNELCVRHPAATYFVRVEGDSMTEAGIFPDDILVVDRSVTAAHGDIVIASVENELTVKRLELRPTTRLLPCNPAYPPIEIDESSCLEVFGVVTNVVRQLKRG